MTCRRRPCTFSSRVIGRSSQSGPLQGVVTLGTIGQMALTVSCHKCQHYSDSVHTSRVPIIMTPSADPTATGIVTSLVRPGGNITGITEMMPELTPQRLRLLKQIVP